MSETAESDAMVLTRITECVQAGKVDAGADLPPGSRGRPGVVELVERALADHTPVRTLLDDGLLAGMKVVGRRFAASEIFIPEVLIAARALKAGFAVLKPHFAAANVPSRGTFVIGTVRGDLHDIGKNLVSIILEGSGWRIIDLGTDCSTETFVAAVDHHPGCTVGLSALLTTTMINMRETVAAIRERAPHLAVLVGGAPVTPGFAAEIGASGYAANPAEAVALLDRLAPAATPNGGADASSR